MKSLAIAALCALSGCAFPTTLYNANGTPLLRTPADITNLRVESSPSRGLVMTADRISHSTVIRAQGVATTSAVTAIGSAGAVLGVLK